MITRKEAIRYQLEIQSTQIELVLKKHGITAVVIGGKVLPRLFCFEVQYSTPKGNVPLRILQQALAEALGVAEVRIETQESQMLVRVPRRQKASPDLLALIKSVGEIRPLTTILGAAEDGRPLMLNLDSADVSNILVVGQAGAGKSSLLRALLFSLAAKNKQHQFQAVVVDYEPTAGSGEGGPLAAFNHLPHLVLPVARSFAKAVEALDFLVDETQYRLKQEVDYPRIVLVIDNLDSLLAAGERSLLERLLFLLENGSAVGLHLVLALENPIGPFTDLLFRCDLPVRFIGRVSDDKMARAAAGIPDTGAEYLTGKGDFIGVGGGNQLRFQSAPISDYELYLAVEQLGRQRRSRIGAGSAVFQPGVVAVRGG